VGLIHPRDLATWRRWQRGRHRIRFVRDALTPSRSSRAAELTLLVPVGSNPTKLVALDSRSVTSVRALHGVITPRDPVAVVSSVHSAGELMALQVGRAEHGMARLAGVPESVEVVVSAGHYLPAGAFVQQLAEQRGLCHVVVQHGLLTPFAPPLPPHAHLFAFSDSDAAFWATERDDVTSEVIGSSLLWEAAALERPEDVSLWARPIHLGQLHGAELSRRGKVRAVEDLWSRTGAVYRPHPAETDRLSRLRHRAWERSGMVVDRSGRSLRELNAPVVSAFSTGILEAAARGLPAWAHYPSPPKWLEEFWERYRINRWSRGADPTPPPELPQVNPVEGLRVALNRLVGEAR